MTDTNRNELKKLIAEVMREEMAKFYQPQYAQGKFDATQAVAYLNSIGCPTTKNSLYCYVSRGNIAVLERSGRNIVFAKEELDRFAQSRIVATPSIEDAAARIQEKARARLMRARIFGKSCK